MSEPINNERKRKDLLKHMILQLHEGEAPETVKKQLIHLMGQVPYNDIIEVEQELISEGLPQEEVLKLCDIHSAALKGAIDHSGAKTSPAGHPVHTFIEENRALQREISSLEKLYDKIAKLNKKENPGEIITEMQLHFNSLMDVEKHYQRKENLLFPFLEKHGITGPPTVMWGKHDETRELLKGVIETLNAVQDISVEEAKTTIELVLKPASTSVEEMIFKEEQILFPMSLDKLSDAEWYQVYKQSIEIGFCLYDPKDDWKPEGIELEQESATADGKIQLPSGSFSVTELTTLLNTIPFDLTFVDKDDTVRYFTQGKERIFARNRAILGRKVQLCHPPSSVHIVEKILDDFKSGGQDSAAFWINLGGKFIHIEYFAMRDNDGNYLGTLEVSQDLTEKRKIKGEQRLLTYANKESSNK
ncbi:MAG: hemerythrin [Desulfovibrio sp. S3730MH75]|nr:MAG: hemerythrin [Desulfovibrio sp. S3730MH75]